MNEENVPQERQRWALKIEYDGRAYIGWQKQKTGLSIQQLIEEAAAHLVKQKTVETVTSGRTDAGVHASGMVIHLDLPAEFSLKAHSLRDGINHHLRPHLITILEAVPVSLEWNARFSALWRRYRYTILNRPARPALYEGLVWHVKHPLNCEKMQEAAQYFLGRHDFTSFRAAACQAKNPLRTLDELSVCQEKDCIFIETQARAFLHHQVRNMVGSLALVGLGRWEPFKIKEVLRACDRTKAGPTAPAGGLCFIDVGYGEKIF